MWSRMPKLGTSGSERGWASIRKKRARLLTTLAKMDEVGARREYAERYATH
jgi:hypothetical protein